MDKIEKDLDELELVIENAKEEKNKLLGMLETILKQMKERFGASSVEEIAKLLQETKDLAEKKQKELEKKYKGLKEAYEW